MFQSLLGRLQTSTLINSHFHASGFQSLLGRLQTTANNALHFRVYRFQSLLGRLQTLFGLRQMVFYQRFNPSQVGFKLDVLRFQCLCLGQFQSLLGRLQTMQLAQQVFCLFGFNPSQVGFKLLRPSRLNLPKPVSIPLRQASNHLPHHRHFLQLDVSIPLRQASNSDAVRKYGLKIMFQSLLGRLQTALIRAICQDISMFQSLLGRLQTHPLSRPWVAY